MTAPVINSFFEPYLGALMTILLAYLSIKLLGDTVQDVVKFIMEEIKGAFTGHVMHLLNVIVMLVLLVACYALFVPSLASEMAGIVHPAHETDDLTIIRIGAACFIFFMLVVAGVLSTLICRNAP